MEEQRRTLKEERGEMKRRGRCGHDGSNEIGMETSIQRPRTLEDNETFGGRVEIPLLPPVNHS
jgi:hypothetical protein